MGRVVRANQQTEDIGQGQGQGRGRTCSSPTAYPRFCADEGVGQSFPCSQVLLLPHGVPSVLVCSTKSLSQDISFSTTCKLVDYMCRQRLMTDHSS